MKINILNLFSCKLKLPFWGWSHQGLAVRVEWGEEGEEVFVCVRGFRQAAVKFYISRKRGEKEIEMFACISRKRMKERWRVEQTAKNTHGRKKKSFPNAAAVFISERIGKNIQKQERTRTTVT